MFSKINFTLFGKRVNAALKIAKKRDEWIGGIGNRCRDGKYVVFLDYDGVPLDYVREEVKVLCEKYYLSNGYIFETNNGYHVIFLEKFNLGTLLDIMDDTACDKNYRDVPLLYGRKVWVLRQTKKGEREIKYLETIKSGYTTGERSRAHGKFLVKRYNIRIDLNRRMDNSDTLTFASYYVRRE